MNVRFGLAACAATMALLAGAAQAAEQLDANLIDPPGVYYGTGNHNGHFTIDSFGTDGELALRGHERSQDATSPSGDVYTVALGRQASFDFSFNPFGVSLDGLSSLLTITNLLTHGTASFDPLAVGDDAHAAAFPGSAQNSEYLGFGFLNGSPLGNINYSPNVNATYQLSWTVSGANFAPATTTIFINQGAGSVPEPMTWALMLAGFAGLGATLRRRRAMAVA